MITLIKRVKKQITSRIKQYMLPKAVKEEILADQKGRQFEDAGPEAVAKAGARWLARAQDCSTSADGGVARHYSLISGWAPSYPETTGYIVPTIFETADRFGDADLARRGEQMLQWLVKIQLKDGSYQGGVVGTKHCVPVVFNTGQILIGLAYGAMRFGDPFARAMHQAAEWLVAVQDDDGCWSRHQSPFANKALKTYDTHTAWGLLEAARFAGNDSYATAALRNVDWTLSKQHANGWFSDCCLSDANRPLTHTVGYALRGVVEAYRYSQDRRYLESSLRTADGVLTSLRSDGFLPGRLDKEWHAAANWSCLTGASQLAHCLLILGPLAGRDDLVDAALRVNSFVRRTIRVDGAPNLVGAVKGSYPINGGYRPFEFLNWACKFTVDANIAELELTAHARS